VNLSAEVKALMTKARHALEVAGRLSPIVEGFFKGMKN